MKSINNILFASLLLLLPALATAAQTDSDIEQIKSKFSSEFPDLQLNSISPAPISGLYQVIAGQLVFYASPTGRYIVQGDIIDLDNQQANLTEQVRQSSRNGILNSFDEAKMIVFAPEETQATVTIFTDIDCGYCRKLHKEIDKLVAGGIKVRYMAFPRTGFQGESFDKAVSVWCSKDRNTAMTDAKQGRSVAKQSCENPVAEELQVGIDLGVNATPTLIFEDGIMWPGYLPASKLIKMAKKHVSN